jgi:hypothetical protein
MTHVSRADETLARQVSKKLGRKIAARKVAKLREAGLITWPPRPGKVGRPGRAPGSYPLGTDRQVIEALDLIRSKIDKETVAAILYLREWHVSLTARLRFMDRWLERISTALPIWMNDAGDGSGASVTELNSSQAEPLRIVRSVVGANSKEVFEWLAGVVAGDELAIESPHPDVASALNITSWTDKPLNYEDGDFVDAVAPGEVVERVRRWSHVAQLLIDPTTRERLDSIAGSEEPWERARLLMQAFLRRDWRTFSQP